MDYEYIWQYECLAMNKFNITDTLIDTLINTKKIVLNPKAQPVSVKQESTEVNMHEVSHA